MLLSVFAYGAAAQIADSVANDAADSTDTRVSGDTIKLTWNDYKPTGVRFGTDLIAIAKSQYVKGFSGWEVNGDVDFYRYYLVADYGMWRRDYISDSSSYSNNGRYFRAGVDVNFLKKDPDRNMLFFGIRYGRGNFSETLSTIVKDSLWGTYERSYNNDKARAGWFELTGGLRVKMWKFIWLGYTARFKFGLYTRNTSIMLPFDVPGYGHSDKTSTWGFNYQILIRIPVRKAPPVRGAKL